MEVVIGLLEAGKSPEQVRARLVSSGFAQDTITVLDDAEDVRKQVKFSLRQRASQEALIFGVMGTVVFGIFGALSGAGTVQALGATAGWAVGATFLFALIGALFGVFMGSVMGASDAEHTPLLYQEGVAAGDKVILVQVKNDDQINKATSVLRQEKATNIKNCKRIGPATSSAHGPAAA